MRRSLVMAAIIVMLGAGVIAQTTANEPASPPNALGPEVVAEVDGQKISPQEYYDRLERLSYTDPATGRQSEAGAYVLDRLVREKLILRLADKEEVAPTDQQVQERMDRTMKTPGFEAQMKAQGLTEEGFRELMRVEQAAFNIQTKGITVTNAEARAFYGKHSGAPPFISHEQAMVAAIFLKDKADTARAQALLKTGVDFGTVAAQLSQDPVSSKQGGRLSRAIIRGDQNIPAAIQDVILRTKVGEYTEPIQAGGGSAVIFKVLSHQPKRVRPFSEFEYLIRQRLAIDKGIKAGIDVNKKLEEFRQTVTIDVGIERYKAFVMENAPTNPTDVLSLPEQTLPAQE